MHFFDYFVLFVLIAITSISPVLRHIIFFILWPLRLPFMLVGYFLVVTGYVLTKIFDEHAADATVAGLVDDGSGKSLFRRIGRTIRYHVIARKHGLNNLKAIQEKGLLASVKHDLFGNRSKTLSKAVEATNDEIKKN